MKQKKSTQIVALIALLAILLWVIWTGINFFLTMNQAPTQADLTPEQLEQIKDDLNKQLEEENKTNASSEENTNWESEK